MLSLQDSLARLGANELAYLLGSDTLELLEKLQIGRLGGGALAELVMAKLGPQGILLDDVWRKKLFLALPRNEAADLASRLCPGSHADPFLTLLEVRIRRNSEAA